MAAQHKELHTRIDQLQGEIQTLKLNSFSTPSLSSPMRPLRRMTAGRLPFNTIKRSPSIILNIEGKSSDSSPKRGSKRPSLLLGAQQKLLVQEEFIDSLNQLTDVLSSATKGLTTETVTG
jgi:hypothetical protein